jgi:CubicO group peptidase (beta-lactamase class C family)
MIQSMMKVSLFTFTLAVLIGRGWAEPEDVSWQLERIRLDHHLPALAAAAVDNGKVVGTGVAGRRRVGYREPVTLADKWEVGSCTKSMTASVAAMLIEEGLLRWDSTLEEVFPELTASMSPEWPSVTLEQLLLHKAGAPHNPPEEIWKAAQARVGTATEQRLAFVRSILALSPENPPGTQFLYSDTGYAIVGAMMERIAGKPWETLMRERLFVPLGLESAGFGEPASPGKADQPWGHRGESPRFRAVAPGPAADYPPAIGPAACVHMSIVDFARYATWHVAGARGEGTLLTPESFTKLHTSPGDDGYAMGWEIRNRKWAGGKVLMHTGENEMFYAVMWLGPNQDTCFVATSNADDQASAEACDDAIAMLIKLF